MPLNDADQEDFDSELDDEHIFDANPVPGTEMLGELEERMYTESDQGSGSYAQDGRLEVAEDKLMLDGESQLGGLASEDGQSEIGNIDEVGWGEYDDEIGAAHAADRPGSEIGVYRGVDDIGAAAAADREATEIGLRARAAMQGVNEIESAGEIEPELTPFDLFMEGPTRMGAADRGYGSEIGAADHEHAQHDRVAEYAAEIGAADRGYGDEIGGDFNDAVGSSAMYGPSEIGNMDEVGWGEYDHVGAADAADRPGSEIVGAAVAKVIEKARDNRQPPPPMRAVDVDAPMRDIAWDEELTETLVGAALSTRAKSDPFPLTSEFMLRCGAGGEPRYVRVDTEESYKQFRAQHSPELAELSARLEAHIADPNAHGGDEFSADLSDDIEDLVHLGADVEAAEDAKRIELWMPKRFDGLITAWREGENVCATLTLPGVDGELRYCTTLEPIRKCVAEMSRHASESGVPASVVVGVLPAMGCVLGAGTALKEMAAAAPSILQRPEAAGKGGFVVRIEPKVSPALSALAMLVMACRAGNAQACSEWQRLGALAPAQVRQAMVEAVQIAKAA